MYLYTLFLFSLSRERERETRERGEEKGGRRTTRTSNEEEKDVVSVHSFLLPSECLFTHHWYRRRRNHNYFYPLSIDLIPFCSSSSLFTNSFLFGDSKDMKQQCTHRTILCWTLTWRNIIKFHRYTSHSD